MAATCRGSIALGTGCGKCIKCKKEQGMLGNIEADNITAEEIEQMFNSYGFEPPTTMYNDITLSFKDNTKTTYGLVKGVACAWKETGFCYDPEDGTPLAHLDLTPLKPKWYETVSPQGTLCWYKGFSTDYVIRIVENISKDRLRSDDGYSYYADKLIPLTDDEIEQFMQGY